MDNLPGNVKFTVPEIVVRPVSRRRENDRAAILKMFEAPDKTVLLSANLQPVSSSVGLFKDFFGQVCGNVPVISQAILISPGIANVHGTGVIAFLHHDHASTSVQGQLEIFGQRQK
ncbi:hypothetical protein [Paraburkholderia sp. JHI869]|uniref:hypothetical protein n=1 Tax=Paraburkholderia sp. JHI869 TaxID=3112959 RepID=UPI00317C2C53